MTLYLSVGALVIYFIVMGYVFFIRPKKKRNVGEVASNPEVFDKSKEVTSNEAITEVNEPGKPSKEELKKQLVSTYKAIREVERGGRREVEEQGESSKEQGILSQGQRAKGEVQGVREEKGERRKEQGVKSKEHRARSEGQGEWMTDKEIEF